MNVFVIEINVYQICVPNITLFRGLDWYEFRSILNSFILVSFRAKMAAVVTIPYTETKKKLISKVNLA